MPDRLRSVRLRVTAIATVLVAVAVALAGWLLVHDVEGALQRQVAKDNELQLTYAASLLASGVAPDDVHAQPGAGEFVTVLNGNGAVGSGTPGTAFGTTSGGSSIAGVLATEARPSDYYVRTNTVTVNGTDLTVVAASPLDGVRQSIDTLKRALAIGLPLLVALVAALAWFVVGRALRPVEAIRAEVEAITASTIHRRVPEGRGRDEIGRLARTMNAMLDRLEDSSRRQQQFVSDASHELRSPMAAMRTQLEVAQRVDADADADWPAVADAVLVEEARLEALVGDLLALARGDEGDPPPNALVDLGTIAVDEAARARRVPVTATAAEGTVIGDRAALRSLVAHLLDNAARHAEHGATITVERAGPQVVVTVDDDGAGIPVADRERVFERFARLDDARTRDRGGAGLGLAVVRSIARRHGGDARIEDAPAGGARLVVTIPAAP